MNKIKYISIVLVLLLSSQILPQDKVGTTSFQFLEVMTGARGTSMSGAYSAVANDANAVFWNPAGLTNVNNIDVQVSYMKWILDVKHYSFALAYNIDEIGTFGIQALYTDIGSIEVTRVDALGYVNGHYNPGLTGETISPHQSLIGLTFAKKLTDKFSFGISVKYAYEDLVVRKKGSLVFDGGLTFKTGFKTIELAAAIRQFGPDVKYISESYPLPQTFNIGISGYLFAPDDALIGSLGNQKLLIAYDMIQPRDYNQRNSVGLEYSFNDMVYLRAGYKFNGDQEGLAAGLGIEYNNYRIDYSYDDYGQYLKDVNRITIGFNLK